MEPMTLGSPVGSPSTQNPTSPFLPGYLMGDPAPLQTSPTKTPRQVHFAPSLTSPIPAPCSPTVLGTPTLNDSLSRFHKSQREKSGGPPTIGLFDTLDVSATNEPSTPSSSAQQSGPSILTPALAATPTPTPFNTSMSGEDTEKWVTVFGFPPSAASAVLSQFSQLGHIVEHRFPGQGNWVNICYETRLDARRALSYNGKVLPSHIMVGVVPCKDTPKCSWNKFRRQQFPFDQFYKERRIGKGYMQSGSALKDMTNCFSNTGTPTTPRSQQSRSAQRHFINSPPSSPYPLSPARNARPLGVTTPSDHRVITTQNTPTKSTSMVSKAVDYILGW